MVDIVTGRVGVNEGVVAAVAVAVEHLGVVGVRDDGVRADESADDWVIEPGAIVVEPGLRVQLLVSELVVGDFGPGVLPHLPVGDVFGGLYLCPRGIGHSGGAAEVVTRYLIVKEFKILSRTEIQPFHNFMDVPLCPPCRFSPALSGCPPRHAVFCRWRHAHSPHSNPTIVVFVWVLPLAAITVARSCKGSQPVSCTIKGIVIDFFSVKNPRSLRACLYNVFPPAIATNSIVPPVLEVKAGPIISTSTNVVEEGPIASPSPIIVLDSDSLPENTSRASNVPSS